MMLIDTHIIIWMMGNQAKLSPVAQRAITATEVLGYSAISLWELAMLHQKGRVGANKSIEEWIGDFSKKLEYRLFPITPDVAIRSGKLAMHGDPADRIIVATALELNVPLITADTRIHTINALSVVW